MFGDALRGVVAAVLVIAAACGSTDGPYTYERTGLTELVLTFGDAEPAPDPRILRSTLVELGQRDIQIVTMDYRVASGAMRPALRVQFALSDWPTPRVREEVVAEISRTNGGTLEKIAWAGSGIHMRASAPLDEARLRDIVTKRGLVVRDLVVDHDEGTGEYHAVVRVGGIDAQVERALERKLPGTDVVVESALSVGPQRPRKKRGLF